MELSKDLNPFVRLTRITLAEALALKKSNKTKQRSNIQIACRPQNKKCSQCYFCKRMQSRGDRGYMIAHLSIHTKEEPYSCPQCKSRFSRPSKLKQHIRTVHNKEKYSCPICFNKLTYTQGYLEHLKLHDNSPSEKCQLCEKTFFTKGALKQHTKSAHNEGGHVCLICQKLFSHKCSLKTHISRIHKRIRNHFCEFCPKDFFCKADLNGHMNTWHFKQKDLAKCPEPGCNRTFNHSSTAWEHRIKAHPRPHELDKLKCKTCNKIFAYRSGLKVHQKNMHSKNKPFVECPMCQKTYTTTGSLRQHITSAHTAEKSFRCDWPGCHLEFALQVQLYRHKKYHLEKESGLKYTCEKCPRVFTNKILFSQHQRRVHLSGKRFCCYFCPNGFKSGFELVSHIRTHTGEKPYECQKCKKELSSWSSLNCHNKAKH